MTGSRFRANPRLALLLMATLLLGAFAVPAAAYGTAPLTALSLDPAIPDGSNGWWRSAPAAYATVDQTATLYWTWGSVSDTLAVFPEQQSLIGFADQSTNELTAFSVNEAAETETPSPHLTTALDSVPPTTPTGLASSVGGGSVSLRWDATSDGTSGLLGYRLYRNTIGPPFGLGDLLAQVSEPTTGYSDSPPAASPVLWYAVSAVDRAGNESLLSDAIRVSLDTTPPSPPTNLQAWINGSGFARVSWKPGADVASGLAGYVVRRSIDAAAETTVGVAAGSAVDFDDFDPAIGGANVVTYSVQSLDRAGNTSPLAGPVTAGTDLVPPSTPTTTTVRAVFGLGSSVSAGLLTPGFEVSQPDVSDEGSGPWRTEVVYGPDPDAPAFSATAFYPNRLPLVVTTADEWDSWTFRVRVEDRAGNASLPSPAAGQRAGTSDRLSGADRIATSLAISRATFNHVNTVVVASSLAYPDGLAASALAGVLHAPVMLVGSGPLSAATLTELTRLGTTDAYVIGGTSAVSATTFTSLSGALSGRVLRISGPDRYQTAAAVATTLRTLKGGAPAARVFLVSGGNFPDALSVGPAAYVSRCPILYATGSTVPQVTRNAIVASGATHTVIVGSPSAVWSGAEFVTPGATRVAGSTRYLTSAAFADWAIARGILTDARPLIVTGVDFPDGLSAAPLAGERVSPLVLMDSWVYPNEAWFRAHAPNVQRFTAIGRIAVGQQTFVWHALTLPVSF